MKAKNIISAILIVLSFVACSSEIDGIDNNMTNTTVNSNGETSISVRMKADGAATKSAEQEELTIKNYVIAVFEAESKQRVGYKTETSANGSIVNATISGIDTKQGNMNVIVVANVDNVSAFDNLYTYNEFTSCPIGTLSNLTKVGKKENVTLNANNTLDITLEQLTARVNVTLNDPKVIVNGKGTVRVEFKAYSYSASIIENTKVLAEVQSVKSQKVSLDQSGQSSFSYYTYSVNNPTLVVQTQLAIYVDNVCKQTIDKTIEVGFKDASGSNLNALTAGHSYTQEIDATVTVNQNMDVSFEYEIVEIKNNANQEIEYK